MTPILVPYDPRWADRFEEIAEELRTHGDGNWVVEHIGSTSVPGMMAKPIIDLAVRLDDIADLDRHLPALERAGWRRGSGVRTHPVLIYDEHGVRTRIAHFFTAEEWATVNQRLFAEWLRAHPDDAALYETVKRTAAEDAAPAGQTYNASKTAVIQALVDRARAARGLPSVPVSDKA